MLSFEKQRRFISNGIHNGLYYTYIILHMSSIYEKAVSLLKIRPHHSEELRKKLKLRGFSSDQIDEVIVKLTEEELLNNQQFAQNYVEELIRNKTFGFYGLKAKLMQRGIPGNEADALLKENLSIEKETELAMKIVERAAGLDKIKLAQKLQRKGFRGDVISRAIRNK